MPSGFTRHDAKTAPCSRPLFLLRLPVCGLLFAACLLMARADTPHSLPSAPTFVLPAAQIRVELTKWTRARALTLLPPPDARLTTDDGAVLAVTGGAWTLAPHGKTLRITDAQGKVLPLESPHIHVQSFAPDTPVGVGATLKTAKRYRGSLDVQIVSGHLFVVNVLPLESYLRGVVPCEMGRAPEEALKAQAVAARTFAVSRMLHTQNALCDVRDSTDSQVYGGASSEMPEADRAVAATEGLILTSGSKPIDAQYCADCGGVTEPGETPEMCLPCVRDDDAHGTAEHPHPAAWTLNIPASRLLSLLLPHAGAHPPLPDTQHPIPVAITPDDFTPTMQWPFAPDAFPPATSLQDNAAPTLESCAVVETDRSGRVRKLRCTFCMNRESKPQSVEMSGEAFRRLVGVNILRSLLFKVKCDAQTGLTLTGRGWGHGRGMCQTGAMSLAAAPLRCDFRRILMRYYAGATLAHCHTPDTRTEARHDG